ncbi:MAG: DNA polymerase III subunit gamma/tau [Planctomycetota bacterium]|nr:DNA polymerase III subunit gamma/tau [Planctomycetota bacterium]
MSSYLVLARKYRPRTFAEVVGQDVVTGILIGALEDGRIGHAYLFSGPRGTGKTTTARILAKCLNCEKGPTATPCGACERCVAADEGTEPDLIEIDAATHTGVDNIRELRQQTSYAPMRARYKVYIVDEVHMLSKPAFNALLKTLEEPPPHVVFLFATTELHKVLPTILSRCQVLKLAPLSEERIAARLTEVFEREGVKPGPGVVDELARAAGGGMRDALSLADELLALAGDEPSLEDLRRLGGHTGTREVEALLQLVEAGDKAAILATLSEREGGETELVAALLAHLRKSLIAAHCGEDAPALHGEGEDVEPIRERARRLDPERVELWMQELLHAQERMRLFGGMERLVLELVLLDLARPEATLPLTELEVRLLALEGRVPVAAGPTKEARVEKARAAPSDELPRPAAGPAAGGASPPPRSRPPQAKNPWSAVLDELDRSHGGLAELLRAKGRLELTASEAIVRVDVAGEAERRMAEDRRNRAAVTKAILKLAERPVEVRFELGDGARMQAPAAGSEPPAEESRADAFTTEVADLFDGVIEDGP